ncbi:hypothetical protein LCGC14_2330410 [marine sediment metagenome]|uniref:Uncharacterized protein n=1 Tax=marine sediment metagenome TaxID=412755 RepID=A0A0F9FA40_9ZZZZ
MKSHNPNMCRGIQTIPYNGPEICATLSYGKKGERRRTVKVSGRLNNPRKTDNAVLTEICAKVKAQHPTAKLMSFKRKERS